MLLLTEIKTGKVVNEGNQVVNPDGSIGIYTGHMPPHARNERGLMYVKNGKEWDDCYIPENTGYKLVDA